MRRLPWTDAVWLLCVSFMWGSAYPIAKVALRGFSPVLLTVLQLGGATVVLFVMTAWLKQPWRLRQAEVLPAAVIGLLGHGLFLVLMNVALRLITSAQTTLLIYAYPFLIAIGARLFLRELLGPTRAAGLVVGFGGVVFLFAGSAGGALNPGGAAAALGAALVWAVAALVMKRWLVQVPPLTLAAWQAAFSALVLAPALTFDANPLLALSGPAILALVWLTLLSSALAYYLWYLVLARNDAAVVSAHMFATPVFSVTLGAWWLGEPLTAPVMRSLLCVAAAIYLVSRRPPGSPATARSL